MACNGPSEFSTCVLRGLSISVLALPSLPPTFCVPPCTLVRRPLQELRIEKMIEMRGRSHEDPLQEVAALQYLSQQGHANVLQCTEVILAFKSTYVCYT